MIKKATAVKKKKPIDVKMYSNKSYSEEYQITGLHYAFVSSPDKGSAMCHWWIKCRDFLQDALRNQLTGRNDAIYSFAYKPGVDPDVDTARTRMLVKIIPQPQSDTKKEDFDEKMAAGLKIINYYEKKYDFKPLSKIVKVNHKDYPALFIGPGIWSQGSVMISMYTFFIRLGHWKPKFKTGAGLIKQYEKIIGVPEGQQTNDTRYLQTTYKNFNAALENLELHLFKQAGEEKVLFHDSPMSGFHHHSGIVSLSQGNTPVKPLNDKFRKIFSKK
jgi:hypothetical protein